MALSILDGFPAFKCYLNELKIRLLIKQLNIIIEDQFQNNQNISSS